MTYEMYALLDKGFTDYTRMFGTKDQVTETRWTISAARLEQGRLLIDQALYMNIKPGLPVSAYKIKIPKADVLDVRLRARGLHVRASHRLNFYATLR